MNTASSMFFGIAGLLVLTASFIANTVRPPLAPRSVPRRAVTVYDRILMFVFGLILLYSGSRDWIF